MKITIPYVLAGLLASGEVASQLQLGGCRNGVQTRKNVNALTQDELNRYFNAIKKLNTGTSGIWAKLTNTHVRYKDFIHSNQRGEGRDVFLAWHRAFLRELEARLQEIDSSITIPYWDWSVKERSEKNKVFSTNLFGGPGVQNNRQCIADGPFKAFTIYATISSSNTNQCLSRSSFTNVETVSDDVISANFLTKKAIREFKRIEMSPHALPHNNVGGMMSTHGSPADPLFFSHHAFIDKLWNDYQKINPELSQEYGMPLDAPIKYGYDNIRIGEVMNTENLCYEYPQEHYKWKNGPLRTGLDLPPSSVDPIVEAYLPPKGLNSEQLEQFDRAYILKGTLVEPKQLGNDSEFYPIPKPVSVEYIENMGWNLIEFRQEERKLALIQDSFNRARLDVSGSFQA